MTGWPDLLGLLREQQLLAGMLAMAATGAAVFALREVPAKALAGLREMFSVCLILDSDDQTYAHVTTWLARHGAAKRARRLMMAQAYNYDVDCWEWQITLGQGWHLVRHLGAWILLHRHIQEPDALGKMVGAGKRERIFLYSLGWGQAALRSLMAGAEREYLGGDLLQVRFWAAGCYQLADRRRSRSMDTVFLPEAQKRRLVGDLQRFLRARGDYAVRGIPWRRGYFLKGPPGTGKTTLILTLAAAAGRSPHVVNLANLGGDNELFMAVNAVGADGVLVLEDIDAIVASRDREVVDQVQADRGGARALAQEAPRGVTLSGLLNALDGVTAREGRILFITSNRPEVLDKALIRPGRVDLIEEIGPLDEADAWAMYRAFRPHAPRSGFERLTAGRLPMPAAELQGLLLATDDLGDGQSIRAAAE